MAQIMVNIFFSIKYFTIEITIKFRTDSGNNTYQDNCISDLVPNLGKVALISIKINTKIKVFIISHKTCSK